MGAALVRLLKLRVLMEESSRMELEQRAALAARIASAQQRERESARDSRGRAQKSICEENREEEQARQRTTEWSSAEAAWWRERQLEPLAQATARRVEEGRAEFFERRKERRQVESVLEAERERLQAEQERRLQRELDDWFGMKQIRRTLKEQKQGVGEEQESGAAQS